MQTFQILQQVLSVTEVLAFVLSMIALIKNPSNKKLKILFLILLLTIITEFGGSYIFQLHVKGESDLISNAGVYNIYNILTYVLWFYLFSMLLKGKQKVFCYLGISIYLCSIVIEASLIIDFRVYLQVYAHILGSLLLAIMVVFYFIRVLQEQLLQDLSHSLFVWMSCGILFYYVNNIPYRIVSNKLAFLGGTNYIFFYTKLIFAVIMYCFISIGFFKFLMKQNFNKF